MSADRLVTSFAGDRATEAPLTWGQRSIWSAIEGLRPSEHFLNMRRVVPLSARAAISPDAAAAAVGRLIGRHEALRTLYPVIDGSPRQVVVGSGEHHVEVVEAGPDELDTVATKASEALQHLTFDHDHDLPLRTVLVTCGGVVRRVGLVVGHLSIDGFAADLLLRDLRLSLLRGTPPAPTGWQPVDLARAEATRDGLNARALRYWDTEFRRIPPTMFDETAAASTPRYQRYLLTWRPLAAAAESLARRHGVSSGTVLLTATAALVARWTGHRTVAMHTLVHNRFQPGHAGIVGTLVMLGLFTLDLDTLSVPELIPAARGAALRAYHNAYYAPPDRDAVAENAGRERGLTVDPHCCFNDVRVGDTSPAGGPAEPVIVAREHPERMHCRFCIELHDSPDGLGVLLTADTRSLPPEAMHRFLRELAELVVESADGGA